MIEALASGLPVLAARSGATGEVVDEGETGFLYDPGSDAALVAAVRKIVSDDGLRTKMGRNARASSERRDWGTSTRTLRGYYEQALGER
jgi:glycosyltransferase involved in cell wall biosynthesis